MTLRGGEGSASHPGRSLPLGNTWYSLYRRLGGPQGQSGQVRKISPTGIQSLDRQARSQLLYWLSYPGPPYPCTVVKKWQITTDLTAPVFWDMIVRHWLSIFQHFRETQCLYLEGSQGAMFLQQVKNCLSSNAASYPTAMESSPKALWKHQNSHNLLYPATSQGRKA